MGLERWVVAYVFGVAVGFSPNVENHVSKPKAAGSRPCDLTFRGEWSEILWQQPRGQVADSNPYVQLVTQLKSEVCSQSACERNTTQGALPSLSGRVSLFAEVLAAGGAIELASCATNGWRCLRNNAVEHTGDDLLNSFVLVSLLLLQYEKREARPESHWKLLSELPLRDTLDYWLLRSNTTFGLSERVESSELRSSFLAAFSSQDSMAQASVLWAATAVPPAIIVLVPRGVRLRAVLPPSFPLGVTVLGVRWSTSPSWDDAQALEDWFSEGTSLRGLDLGRAGFAGATDENWEHSMASDEPVLDRDFLTFVCRLDGLRHMRIMLPISGLPECLGILEQLRTLEIRGHRFQGKHALPMTLANLAELREFVAVSSSLRCPPQEWDPTRRLACRHKMGKLAWRCRDISWTGRFDDPSWPWWAWSKLRKFHLDGTWLHGPLPAEELVMSWPKLQVLDLGNNALEGSVPSDFGRFSALGILKLHGNFFSGVVPLQAFAQPRVEMRLDANPELSDCVRCPRPWLERGWSMSDRYAKLEVIGVVVNAPSCCVSSEGTPSSGRVASKFEL